MPALTPARRAERSRSVGARTRLSLFVFHVAGWRPIRREMTQKPTSAAAASAADEQRDPELAARKFECVEAAHRACREATARQPLWTMIPDGCHGLSRSRRAGRRPHHKARRPQHLQKAPRWA